MLYLIRFVSSYPMGRRLEVAPLPITRALLSLPFVLVGMKWIPLSSVHDTLTSRNITLVGKRHCRARMAAYLCTFWITWKEKKSIAFETIVLHIRKLQYSFISYRELGQG